MRHQFYADSRDAQKWSIILDASRKTGSAFWIVMLRPDAPTHGLDSNHGKNYQTVAGHDAVIEFFAEERKRIANGEQKDLLRTAGLFEQPVIGFEIFADLYPIAAREQDVYFQRVLASLNARDSKRRDVVFLDPDNGISGATAGPEYVRPEHLRLIWSTLRAGDTMVVYQHQFRQTGWDEVKRQVLERIVGGPVISSGTGAVRFFVAEKLTSA